MIARWEQGRATVDQLIDEERLQKVSASRELADLMVARARTHLGTAAAVSATDPVAAFQTLPLGSPTRVVAEPAGVLVSL
jgi:hypothetical protein